MKSPAEHHPDHPPEISAVVITYQPEASALDNLRKLAGQVAQIIVVDNGSIGASARLVESAANLPGIHLIRNGTNLGIATALNIGIRFALQSGSRWIATFDQDSAIPEHYFDRLLQAYEACPAAHKVGMLVPGRWAEAGTPAGRKPVTEEPSWSFVRGAVNSGGLINAGVFPTVGFYDDALFIDYVDTDFCLRLQKGGFKILSVNGVVLDHELGIKQTLRLLGWPLSFRIHTAWRYYYIMRNRLILHRRYLAAFPSWSLRDATWLLLELGRMACLEKDRRIKLSIALRGVSDGLRGKTGRHPDFPPKIK